jgi:hypothetical protein
VSEDRRVAGAALCLSAALLFLALPEREPHAPRCARPGELASRDGWTLRAGCAPQGEDLPVVRGPARRLFGLPLDPNRASPASLETLPGIGPARAAAIAAARSRAPFCEISDLERVPGIGPRTLAKLSGLVEIDPVSCTGR